MKKLKAGKKKLNEIKGESKERKIKYQRRKHKKTEIKKPEIKKPGREERQKRKQASG